MSKKGDQNEKKLVQILNFFQVVSILYKRLAKPNNYSLK